MRYTDPTGHWLETVWDIANILWDIYEVQRDPSLLNIGALVVDVGAAIIPFVPGGVGAIVHGGKAVKVAVEAASHLDEAADVARVAAEAASHADEVVDVARAGAKVAEGLAEEAAERVGKEAAEEAQSFIDDIVQTELKNVRLSQHPQYSPDIPLDTYGLARRNTFTQIGPRAIQEGRRETLITIVHEEMHHRLWARGWRLPVAVEEDYVERVAQRFARLKGW
ncbi:MAG: hypothetical protein H5U03_01380 [Clostridia bacterium]|nr:hypothetical protein [Clostridia bacterium]